MTKLRPDLILLFSSYSYIPKIVPVVIFTPMFDEPSKGS